MLGRNLFILFIREEGLNLNTQIQTSGISTVKVLSIAAICGFLPLPDLAKFLTPDLARVHRARRTA